MIESGMREASELVVPVTTLHIVVEKPSDNRVLECAVEGNVDYIVTGDRKHLLPMGQFGGTSLFGGEGGIKNTILGVVIFGILSNGLNLLPNISIYFKDALEGIILVGALLLNVLALRLEKVQTRTE